MNKLEARKMQMLVSQRKKLEEELLVLEDEILNAVRMDFDGYSLRLIATIGKETSPKNPEIRRPGTRTPPST